MNNRTPLLTALTVAFTLIMFVGCSDDPTGDSTPKRVIPKSGSTYTYTRTEKTPTGTTIAGTDTTHVVTSLSDFVSFSGKDSVISFVDVNMMNSSATPDTTTIAYESNGDISIYRGAGIDELPIALPITIPTWWQLPFKSKSTVTILNDTSKPSFTIGIFTIVIESISGVATGYANSENVNVAGQVFPCDKADVTFTIMAKANGLISLPIVMKTTYLFNESLGYFVSFDTQNSLPDIVISQLGIDPGNNIQVLTGYNVK